MCVSLCILYCVLVCLSLHTCINCKIEGDVNIWLFIETCYVLDLKNYTNTLTVTYVLDDCIILTDWEVPSVVRFKLNYLSTFWRVLQNVLKNTVNQKRQKDYTSLNRSVEQNIKYQTLFLQDFWTGIVFNMGNIKIFAVMI